MQSKVELQNLFSYSFVDIFLLVIVLVVLIIIYFVVKYKSKMMANKPIVVKKQPKQIDLNKIKSKYLKLLFELSQRVSSNKLSIRMAYQELSDIIRKFVFETTNIKVQNYTLQEIKSLNMPMLSELIEEYYHPEFSYEGIGNILDSIEKTKEAINKWS